MRSIVSGETPEKCRNWSDLTVNIFIIFYFENNRYKLYKTKILFSGGNLSDHEHWVHKNIKIITREAETVREHEIYGTRKW